MQFSEAIKEYCDIEIIEEIEDNGIFDKFDSFLFFALFVINVMN